MSVRFNRQDLQIASTTQSIVGYLDNIVPTEAAYETNPTLISTDLNNLRSQVQNILNRDGAFPSGNWWDDLTAPTALETGTVRGVDANNVAIHALEKKRFLRKDVQLIDVTVGAGNAYVILSGSELPANTTISVGTSTKLGTVAAFHGGTFGTHALTEVSGTHALNPQNLVDIVDGATRDPILSSNRVVRALLHSETATDTHVATGTTPLRLQLSFIRQNAAGDDYEIVPFADIEGLTINVCFRERVRFEDLNEQDLLNDAKVDVPAGATVNRQVSYDNQGATPVTTTVNAFLDIGTGLTWELGDQTGAPLVQAIEGSAGGTSQFNVNAAVDEMDVDAVVVDYLNGMTIRSGGTRPIRVGVTDGEIDTTASDLMLRAFAELLFNDGNQSGSTWAQDGIKLSDTTAEWDAAEAEFGEISILAMIVAAKKTDTKTIVNATLTSNVTAGVDVNGPGTPHANTDVDLAPYDVVGFSKETVEVYLNGELLFTTVDVTVGGTPADGDLIFTEDLKGTGGGNPDSFTQIVYGQ